MAKRNITVLGAGVIGLTTAFKLSNDDRNIVTVVSKHMPGDYDIEYASPWAGANYGPVADPASKRAQYEADTWPELENLARNLPSAGVHFQDNICYKRSGGSDSYAAQLAANKMSADAWFKDIVPNFKVIRSGLPPGMDHAISYTSVCINTAIYLPWLVSQCLKNGVVFRRGIVDHVLDAGKFHHTGRASQIIVNCTGLSSMKLGGVMDKTMYPIRGQTVLVRNDPGVMTSVSGSDDDPEEVTYAMHRAAGGGTILGGCYQVGRWNGEIDLNLAMRIMKRNIEICPDLTKGKGVEHLSIIRHSVGLRPARTDGPRLEKERMGHVWVVHQYGHAGAGYQCSYGSAKEAIMLIEEAFKEIERANL